MEKVIYKLIKKCNLGDIINGPIRVMGGLLNRMYRITTTKGSYAVKLLNQEVMKRKDAKDNHILAETASNIAKEKGIKALPALIINNKIIWEVDGYYFLIFNWFDGKAITNEQITMDKVKKVSKELAKLHQIDFSKIKNKCKAYYDLKEVDWDYYLEKINNKELNKLLKENIKNYKMLDKRAIENIKLISNNMVISHRDLDLPNVLWNEKDEPVFIDWESTGLVNPVMELIDTAWNWSGGQNYFDKEKFSLFINTYKENGGSVDDFDKALKADFKAKFGWLEYNIRRITGIECIDEEERLLGEKEVIRTIDEINKFNLYSKYMKA